jgi:small subunit ribosomal protein S17
MSEETMENQETAIAEIVKENAIQTAEDAPRGRRTEKVGIVTSDKMQKTIVVRVDRLVKHPVYKRYIRKRSKFMAHNEIEGVSIGDQVRIIETRPYSARKRWRVAEVIRKASK